MKLKLHMQKKNKHSTSPISSYLDSNRCKDNFEQLDCGSSLIDKNEQNPFSHSIKHKTLSAPNGRFSLPPPACCQPTGLGKVKHRVEWNEWQRGIFNGRQFEMYAMLLCCCFSLASFFAIFQKCIHLFDSGFPRSSLARKLHGPVCVVAQLCCWRASPRMKL